jgi:putative phosphoesterase
MKIGVLSDTHNHLENLRRALAVFESQDISTLIHCGDFTGVEIAQAMQGFRVIGVFGNGDAASGEIRRVLLEQNLESYAGLLFRGEIGGSRIAVVHGHMPALLEELVRSQEYEYVFQGHSHQHGEELVGNTRVINPGALGGLHRDQRHICILDLSLGKTRFMNME